MKSKMFEGKDEYDLNSQIYVWQLANRKIIIKQKHPIERLAIKASQPADIYAKKEPAPNLVSVRVDYEESN